MRVEYLSDHGGEQLRQAEQQLRAAADDAEACHRAHDQAMADYKAARRGKPFWKRLLGVSTPQERAARRRAEDASQQAAGAHRARQQIAHRVEQHAAGTRGEDALADSLSGLSDEWAMLRGYRNRRGETDHVLVGPNGVWAIEVKLRRVRLHVDGEEWRFQKLDRWGNTVDRGWATDRSGRSWGRQVSDVAEDLAAWLSRNHYTTPIHTAVMLMHDQAQIGQCDNVPVDLIATHPDDLLREIRRGHPPIEPDECGKIVDLIRRDHRHHNNRPKRAPS